MASDAAWQAYIQHVMTLVKASIERAKRDGVTEIAEALVAVAEDALLIGVKIGQHSDAWADKFIAAKHDGDGDAGVALHAIANAWVSGIDWDAE